MACIQALNCHTGRCPSGVATQDPRRGNKLDVGLKSQRVYNFHRNTLEALKNLLEASGLNHPSELGPEHVIRRISKTEVRSYLDIFPLIPQARQPRAAVAHWYTPPYIVDLVDLAPGPRTNPEVMPALKELYEGFGKAPLVFTHLVPGYIANRLQAALNLECLRMIGEFGISAEDIDFSIRHGLVERLAVLGHMRKMDYTGLEMVRNGIAGRTYQPPVNTGESPVLDRLIEAGRSGVRSGAGFYDYGGTAAEDLFHERDLRLLQLKTQLQKSMGEEQ